MRRFCYVMMFVTALLYIAVVPANATIHTIDVGDSFFSPLKTVVQWGDTVQWNWVGSFPHSTTSDAGSSKTWDSGIQSSGSFSMVIDEADGLGPFPYLCSVHAATMKDTLYVAVPGATTHTINIGDNFFSPLKTVVRPGDTVQWNWVGSFPHSTTSDAGSPKLWDSGIKSSGTFSVVIDPTDGPGPFPYHCDVHALTMFDTLFVDADTDGDGLYDSEETILGTNPSDDDSDGDNVTDDIEVGDPASPTDTDSDLTIDALDPDDDGDGVPTLDEDVNANLSPLDDDTDNDFIPNYLDDDDDGDGILTLDEDANMNGDPTDDDSDGDTIPDYLDDFDNSSCCVGSTGDVNGDGSDDISDLLFLVDYQFVPGAPAPPCIEEADVDGSASVDISDLLYLVDYQFVPGSPSPVPCP